MSKLEIYVTQKIPDEALKILREVGEARMNPQEFSPPKETLMREVVGVEGLLCFFSDKVSSEIINASGKLKVISNCAVGFDNIDVKAATDRGVYVTNTPGVLTETAADLTWALLMSIARRVVEAERFLREGKWKAWSLMLLAGSDVHGKTLGIVGFGRIGEAVARRSSGFNMKVIYHDKTRKEELEKQLGLKYVDMKTLLAESDYVTLHVPLTEETYHLIGEEEFGLMKKTAYLVNTSRGPVVDEEALFRALKERRIAGAALDVFEKEPIGRDNPLLTLKNAVLVPHIGSATVETRMKMVVMAATNLARVLRGKVPLSLVNEDLLKTRPLKIP